MRGFSKRLTYANVMSSIAVFIALGGGAYAAAEFPANSVGTSAIKNGAVTARKLAVGSVTASKLAPNSLTGSQINLAQLGTVPNAAHARTADSATTAGSATTAATAATAGTAANANLLDGIAPSAFQPRVTGTCGAGTAVTQINSDGSVACASIPPSNVQDYAGRIRTGLFSSGTDDTDTFITIPGVAHVGVFNCEPTAATPIIADDDVGQVDMWTDDNSGFDYSGNNWADSTGPPGVTGGMVWYLGVGSGQGAEVIRVTVTFIAGNTGCTFQGTAEVATAQ